MIPSIKICLVLFFSLVTLSSTGTVMAAEYAHEITEKKITFAWTVNGENIDIKISAKTTGWVAVGFNPSEKMQDANIIIGYVKKNKVVISDDFGSEANIHKKDTKAGGKNNISNKSGSETGGITTLEFTIPLNSGDPKDRVIIPDGNTTVLLAYGAGRDSFLTKHAIRVSKTVNLSTGAIQQ
jgi:DOMON domain